MASWPPTNVYKTVDEDEACRQCIKLKQQHDKEPQCNICDRPYVTPSNMMAVSIAKKYRPGFTRSGGIDLIAIDRAMIWEEVPMRLRASTAHKIMLWCLIKHNKEMEELNNGELKDQSES